MKTLLCLAVFAGAFVWTVAQENKDPAGAIPNVFDMREITTVDFEQLNLKQTAVIIPGGILEQHGPYLSVYTDEYSTRSSVRPRRSPRLFSINDSS